MNTTPTGLSVQRLGTSADTGRAGLGGIALRVPSDFDFIEQVTELVAGHCLECGVSPRAARFGLRVALTEALSNAMEYGNGMDAAKLVDVTTHVYEDRIQIQVKDQGVGFDPDVVPDPTHATNLEHPGGRGLFLIRQLVDEVTFNDRGNAICMIWRCD